jgi:hypothetical protein
MHATVYCSLLEDGLITKENNALQYKIAMASFT